MMVIAQPYYRGAKSKHINTRPFPTNAIQAKIRLLTIEGRVLWQIYTPGWVTTAI